LQPMYRSASFFGSETAEKLFIDGICLPSGSGLSNEQLNRVIHVVFRLHKEVAWNAEKSV